MTPYPVHLDGRVMVKGTYDLASNRTTFILPVADPKIDTVVLTDDFGADSGKELTPASVVGKVVTVIGRYQNKNVIIGRSCPMVLEPSRPHPRDEKGEARVDDRFQIARMTVSHQRSGSYNVRSQMEGRRDRTKAVEVPPGQLKTDEIHCPFTGAASAQKITITSNGARPLTITSIVFAGSVGVGQA